MESQNANHNNPGGLKPHGEPRENSYGRVPPPNNEFLFLTLKTALTKVRRRIVRTARSLRTHSFESKEQRKLRELEAFWKQRPKSSIQYLGS